MDAQELLQTIGLTQDDLKDRIIDQACEELLRGKGADEDRFESTLARALGSKIEKRIAATADAFVDKTVGPHVAKYIDQTLLQPTDNWGNNKGTPKTFAEYVIERFNAYLKERVTPSGQTAGYRENTVERGAWLVTQHISAAIDKIIKDSIGTAVATIKDGIDGQIKSVLERTFVEVSTEVGQKR
jgi:hypothetical protein